ncbi:tape measure protein [Christensenella intestinihominis]|uniref:tape measure protein n=1 Tax=Christensenella intestinihominis TaxID=1851429 RepID=UPI00082FB3DE|nr:tape measure protein [Christensenella intestinihominis]
MAHGQVDIDVNLNTKDLKASMNGLQGEIVKGMAVFEVLKQSVSKIAGMVVESIDAAMRRIDTMDQFSRVMTTMTGSADKASMALEKTNSIVTGTAFGLDTAAKGVQAFVASGMEVSKATDTMGAWADAVAFYTKGTNADLETVSMALQKMGTKGNVTMEHLQMLLEAGIPAIQIYASAVGKSTEEVTDQMSKGELKTSDFIDVMNNAFRTGTTGFPSIAGAAKTAGTSWQGSMDNMRAAIARGTAAMLEQLDAAFNVKKGMVQFGKGIESVLKGLANNLDKVAVAATAVIAGFVAFKILKTVQTSMAAINALTTGASYALKLYAMDNSYASAAVGALTLRQALAGTATMVLSGEMSIGAAITLVFKKAVDALNKSFLANPIVLVIALIAALIAVIVQAVTRTNAEAEAARAEAEAMVAAQDELTQSAAQSAAEYEKNMASIKATADEAHNMTQRLEELRSKTDLTAGEQQEMASITAQLTSNYSGLSEMVDENTGALTGNAEQWNKVVDAQAEFEKATLMVERANELTQEATEAEILLESAQTQVANNQKLIADNQQRINELNDKASSVYAKLNSGMDLTADEAAGLQKEYASLIDESENLRIYNNGLKDANKDLEEGMGDLSDEAQRLAREQAAQAELAQKQTQIALNSYKDKIKAVDEYQKISDQMTDEEIANIQALIDAGGQLEEADIQKFNTIKENRAKEAVAEQDYVQAIKDGQVEIDMAYAAGLEERRKKGEELNEIEQATLDRWNDINQQALDKYKGQQQEIVDAATSTKDKIVLSEQQSAKERLAIQEHNNEVTAAYVDNYNSIMGKIPESQKQYLADMTIEDARFLDDMVSKWDEGGKEQWDQYVAGIEAGTAKANELAFAGATQVANTTADTTVNTLEARKGDIEASGGNVGQTIGTSMEQSQAPDEAAQAIADRVVSNLSNADYSAITNGMATAIKNGTKSVQSAAQSMSTSILNVLKKASSDAQAESTRMMSRYATGIRSATSSVSSAMTSVMNSAKTAANAATASWGDIGKRMIVLVVQGVKGEQESLTSAAKSTISNAKASISLSGWSDIGKNMVSGMASGVRNNQSILTSAIEDVVNAAISKAKSTAKIHSPSRAFEDEVGYMFPAGIAVGVKKGAPLALDSVDKMTQSLIKAGSTKVPVSVGVSKGGGYGVPTGVVNNFNQNNTIVNPPQTPGKMYRELRRKGRQLIHGL